MGERYIFHHNTLSRQHFLLVCLLFDIDSDRQFNKYAPEAVVLITLKLFLLGEENVPTARVCGEMLYQFHCFAALLHLPQTTWREKKRGEMDCRSKHERIQTQ